MTDNFFCLLIIKSIYVYESQYNYMPNQHSVKWFVFFLLSTQVLKGLPNHQKNKKEIIQPQLVLWEGNGANNLENNLEKINLQITLRGKRMQCSEVVTLHLGRGNNAEITNLTMPCDEKTRLVDGVRQGVLLITTLVRLSTLSPTTEEKYSFLYHKGYQTLEHAAQRDSRVSVLEGIQTHWTQL